LLDLYKALDYPNPEEMAANAWLEQNAPDVLFENDERVKKVLEARRQSAAGAEDKQPSKSINFKDLPPEGQAQLAEQAGLKLHPEAIAAYEQGKEANRQERSIPQVPVIPEQPGEEQ
jgi:hypothetical protein